MSSLLRPQTTAAALVLILAACSTAATPAPSTLQPTTTAEPTAAPTPSAEPTQTEAATPSQTDDGGAPSGFTVGANPEADALFLDRDDCENLEDGYRLEFPEEWYTNTEIGDVPACSWFSPEFYEVDDPNEVPEEIAITIEYVEGDSGSFEDAISRETVIVGATQEATRVEYDDSYLYQVQLGPTPEEGPNLVVTTTTEMGGDYELNKAVLDRIMATMDFIGSVQ
jgi:hypothetical protein